MLGDALERSCRQRRRRAHKRRAEVHHCRCPVYVHRRDPWQELSTQEEDQEMLYMHESCHCQCLVELPQCICGGTHSLTEYGSSSGLGRSCRIAAVHLRRFGRVKLDRKCSRGSSFPGFELPGGGSKTGGFGEIGCARRSSPLSSRQHT